MEPNEDANGPTQDDDVGSGVEFSDLTPQQQKQLIDYVMQGKPQTPQNQNQARNLLANDPDTVEELCEKLDIEPGADDQQEDEDNG